MLSIYIPRYVCATHKRVRYWLQRWNLAQMRKTLKRLLKEILEQPFCSKVFKGRFAKRDTDPTQGCQMVCFQTKNSNLGKILRVLQWNMMAYVMDTWSILRSFVIFYGHLV
jgi:hypothetical protein